MGLNWFKAMAVLALVLFLSPVSAAPANILLTFDDGPHPETTPWLLGFLKKHNIQATFFWQGEKIKENPALYQKRRPRSFMGLFGVYG